MSSSVSIIRGTNDKPVASRALADAIAADAHLIGDLLIGYPIIGTSEGRYAIDATLVSPEKGIVIFDLVEGTEVGDFQERQDDSANKLEARLKTHRGLMNRRHLAIEVKTITFAPAISDIHRYDASGYPIANSLTLPEELYKISWKEPDQVIYESALSAIQNISTIRKSRAKRNVSRVDSRGAKLKRLEDSIATLDQLQSKAVIETVEGVQRIRGLAGSGKTIVLALKAAYLHAQHPEWRIAVTFNTRSLKGQFRRLITNFSVEQTGDEPDWSNVRILNAWGAPGNPERDGVYHQFCRANSIEHFDFRSARNSFGAGNEFAGICQQALNQATKPRVLYDVILVDEAQDFPPAFLRLCYESLGPGKRLVYAYDELQNLGGESLPPPEEIFGKDSDGSPKVSFELIGGDSPRRDIILEKCYRNSRPVLVTAHSLGFGIYRNAPKGRTTGLVQMFDQPPLWEDIGYRLKAGDLRAGASVVLMRTEESSPRFLEEHSSIDDLVVFKQFKDVDAQADWLLEQITANLTVDELRHDDIVVINPDPLTTRTAVGPVRRRLLEAGIASHLAGVDTDPDIFFHNDAPSVTFTGVYRAKGNEAGVVYILNAQDCNSSTWNLATLRNRLFTAITRSKAWVRVLGVGQDMKELMTEYTRLKDRNFELQFVYPTKAERDQLKILHRDMTTEGQQQLKRRQQDLAGLVNDLEQGNIHFEDLDDQLRARLKALLGKG